VHFNRKLFVTTYCKNISRNFRFQNIIEKKDLANYATIINMLFCIGLFWLMLQKFTLQIMKMCIKFGKVKLFVSVFLVGLPIAVISPLSMESFDMFRKPLLAYASEMSSLGHKGGNSTTMRIICLSFLPSYSFRLTIICSTLYVTVLPSMNLLLLHFKQKKN
jgi:hypothetical protein